MALCAHIKHACMGSSGLQGLQQEAPGALRAHRWMQRCTPAPPGCGSVMWCASQVALPPRNSAKTGAPRARACSSSSSTSTPAAGLLSGEKTRTIPQGPACKRHDAMSASPCRPLLEGLSQHCLFRQPAAEAPVPLHTALACTCFAIPSPEEDCLKLQMGCKICQKGAVRTRALAHDKAVAVAVPGARGAGRVLVAARERLARDEAADAAGDDGRVRAARQHQRRVAAPDVLRRAARACMRA